MLFAAVVLIVVIAYLIERTVYRRYTYEKLTYKASLDASEVTVGDDVYLYEELTNEKILPLPYVKVASLLPEGLAFRLTVADKPKNNEAVARKGKTREQFVSNVESIFVLKGRQRIRRRWRISCRKRGVYSLGDVMIVSNDLIGFNPMSKELTVPKSKSTTITVLPQSVDLERDFTATRYFAGDVVTNHSLLSDPMLRCGVRDYTPIDPISKINWKLTAVHGHFMVNVEDYVQKIQSNVILNTCSQIIERGEDTPESSEFIEYNITVAASLLERFATDNVPSRLIANTPPESIHEDFYAGDDEVGKKIMVTPPFTGKSGLLDAMRTLAILPMKFSMPIERMLDYMMDNPHLFTANSNIIFVTAVLDGRMVEFYRGMAKQGIDVVFYVTTSNRGISEIPPEMKVFYRTYFDSYKV